MEEGLETLRSFFGGKISTNQTKPPERLLRIKTKIRLRQRIRIEDVVAFYAFPTSRGGTERQFLLFLSLPNMVMRSSLFR